MRTIEANINTLKWLLSGDSGISSRALCSCYFGLSITEKSCGNYPHDKSDFDRCVRFLKTLNKDEKNKALGKVAKLSPEWKALSETWEYLESLTDSDILYSKMKSVLPRKI